MKTEEKILETLKKTGQAMSAGQLAENTPAGHSLVKLYE
ncbi:hypothetical protein ES705_36728 [subsurface metagenome]